MKRVVRTRQNPCSSASLKIVACRVGIGTDALIARPTFAVRTPTCASTKTHVLTDFALSATAVIGIIIQATRRAPTVTSTWRSKTDQSTAASTVFVQRASMVASA